MLYLHIEVVPQRADSLFTFLSPVASFSLEFYIAWCTDGVREGSGVMRLVISELFGCYLYQTVFKEVFPKWEFKIEPNHQ